MAARIVITTRVSRLAKLDCSQGHRGPFSARHPEIVAADSWPSITRLISQSAWRIAVEVSSFPTLQIRRTLASGKVTIPFFGASGCNVQEERSCLLELLP